MAEIKPTWGTTNAALAFSLYQAGVPLTPNDAVRNIYTEGGLRAAGYKGDTFRNLAKRAAEEGEKGSIVRYVFDDTDERSFLVDAYNDQRKRLDDGDETGAEVVAELQSDYDEQRIRKGEFLVRLTATLLYLRKQFADLWQEFTPWVRIEDEGAPTTEKTRDGGKIVHHPGFAFVRIDASKEHLEAMGV